jgi:hypothetical protein
LRRKRWIPLTGEIVLRTLDEHSGLTYDELLAELGLDIDPGLMALVFTLIELADADLVAIDGMSSKKTYAAVKHHMSEFMLGADHVWRTTTAWMKTAHVLSEVRLGSRRADNAIPLLCHPVFGKPADHLDQPDIFVLMPFSSELRHVYQPHLRLVAEALNLSIARSDDFYTSTAVMTDIWSAIYASTLVIADCTGRNANVLYELGIAHTVGVPAIMISQSEADIPSDLRHLRYYVYEPSSLGMKQLRNAVQRAAESTRIVR